MIDRTAWFLIAARFPRSIWQGALVVDFALYLRALGWSAVEISLVLSGALILGAMLTITLGPLSDRFGRRRFLLAYDAIQCAAAVVAFLTAASAPLAASAVIGGFGRGGSGAAGPFSPVEQSWLAHCVPVTRRGSMFSINSAVGFVGMAIGASLGALPSWIGGAQPAGVAYRPLFAIAAGLSVVAFVLILVSRDAPVDPLPPTAAKQRDAAGLRAENRLMLRLVLASALNGMGTGLTGPLIAYWFALRFQHGPGSIGPMLAVGFLLGAGASLFGRWLTQRIGIVASVVAMRGAGLLMLIALPFSPTFLVASALYIGRAVLNRGTTGPRSALNVSLVRPSRRGLSSAAANVASQVPRAIGPIVAGVFFESDAFTAPFLLAAVFQGAYIWFYDRSFRRVPLR